MTNIKWEPIPDDRASRGSLAAHETGRNAKDARIRRCVERPERSVQKRRRSVLYRAAEPEIPL